MAKLSKQEVYNFYIGKGYPPNAAAALTGNFHWESRGLDTGAIGDNGTSFGLAQMHADRADALKAAAQKAGVDWTDPNLQLNFIHNELQSRPEGKTLMDPKLSYNDANHVVVTQYERPKDPSLSERNRFDAGKELADNPGEYKAPNFATVPAQPGTAPPVDPTAVVAAAPTGPVNKEPEVPKTWEQKLAEASAPGGSLFNLTQQVAPPVQQQQQAQSPIPQNIGGAQIYTPQQQQLSLLQQLKLKGRV